MATLTGEYQLGLYGKYTATVPDSLAANGSSNSLSIKLERQLINSVRINGAVVFPNGSTSSFDTGAVGFNNTNTITKSHTFSIPSSTWNSVTNKSSMQVRIWCKYRLCDSDGNTLGDKEWMLFDKTYTIAATSDIAPAFNIAVSPSSIIQGKTTVTASITNESLKYGASVSKRSISLPGASSTGTSVSVVPSTSGTQTVTATVTDSRGLSTTKTATYNVTAYAPPSISSVTVARASGANTYDEEGTKVRATVVWGSGGSAGGATSCTLKYRQILDNGYGAYTEFGRVNSGQEYFIDGAFSTESEYEFVATASDTLSSVAKSAILEKAYFTMDFLNGGKGMAIGQACDSPGLSVNMATTFRKSIKFTESALDSIYPVGAVYLSFSNTSPASLFGGEWTPLTGRYLRLDSNTNTGGNANNQFSLGVGNLPSHNHGFTGKASSHSHYIYRAAGGDNADNRAKYYKTDAGSGSKWEILTYGSNGTSSVGMSSASITPSGSVGYTGAGTAVTFMPLYQNVYAWRRTK